MNDPALEYLDQLDAYWLKNHQSPNLTSWLEQVPAEDRDEVAAELFLADLEHRLKLLSTTSLRVDELVAASYLKYPQVAKNPELITELIADEFCLRARNDSRITVETFCEAAAAMCKGKQIDWRSHFADLLAQRQRLVIRLFQFDPRPERLLLKTDLPSVLNIGRATQYEADEPTLYPGTPPRLTIMDCRQRAVSRDQLLITRQGWEQVIVENRSSKVPVMLYPNHQLAPSAKTIEPIPMVIQIGRLKLRIDTAASLKRT